MMIHMVPHFIAYFIIRVARARREKYEAKSAWRVERGSP